MWEFMVFWQVRVKKSLSFAAFLLIPYINASIFLLLL